MIETEQLSLQMFVADARWCYQHQYPCKGQVAKGRLATGLAARRLIWVAIKG